MHNNAKNLANGYYMDAETGTPYLTEMDSYYHLRMTRDISENGHPGNTEKDGEHWDSMSYAPDGRDVATYRPLMAYIAIGVHRIASLFGDVTLEQIAYWLNMFLSALVIIPVFLLTSEMCGILGGIVAAVLSTLNYGYFIHTIPGFYDTDGVIAWVSCLFFYFAIRFVNSIEEKKRNRIILNGAGLAVSFWMLYSSWYVYYMFAAIFAASLIAFTIFRRTNNSTVSVTHHDKTDRSHKNSKKANNSKSAKNSKDIKSINSNTEIISTKNNKDNKIAKSNQETKNNKNNKGSETTTKTRRPLYPLYMAGGIILLIFLLEPNLIGRMAHLLKNVFDRKGGLFPSVFVSIAEMRTPSLWAGGLSGLFQMKVLTDTNIGIINGVGGIVAFLGAFAMCVLFVRKAIKREAGIQHFLLIIWFAVTFVLAFKGWRFIMLFALPVAILAGNLTGWVCSLMDKGKMMDRTVYKTMLILLMLFPSLYGVFKSSKDSVPSANSQMGQVMTAIRENTPEDTILISWWDYGYFFEEKAQRRALFDGGTQSDSRSYWVAKALASSDEKLSANIFRMLSGSGDKACERMLEVFGENENTLILMEDALSAGKEGAGTILAQAGADDATQAELLTLLFPENLPNMECIILPNMARISRWFATFGKQMGSDTFDDTEYSVAMDRLLITSPPDGKSVYKTQHGFNLVIDKTGDSYEAYTSQSADKGSQPLPITKVIVINSKGYTEYTMDDAASDNSDSAAGNDAAAQNNESASSDKALGWTVIIEDAGNQAVISLVTNRMADSTFGKMLYCHGNGLSDFTYESELSNSVQVFNLSADE